MRIDLPYGPRSLPLEVPEHVPLQVLRPNFPQPPADEEAMLDEALDQPIASPPLEAIVRRGQRVALLVDDISRATPTHRILPHVLRRLRRAGVPDEDVQVIFALGSHRPMHEAEQRQKLGEALWGRIAAANSEFRDHARMVRLPGLPGGPDIWIDRRVMEADVRVGIGGILPHPAAGWSGGAKIVLSGVAGEETVAEFHLLHGRTPWNMFGAVDCPVRQAMESWVTARVGLAFIVNVVFTPDGRLYRVVAGHCIEAHRRGVALAREAFCVPVRQRADVVVATSRPADSDLWQAGKGLLAADLAAWEGATAILVAPCPEGAGPHPRYLEFLGADSAEQLLAQADRVPVAERLPLAVAAAGLRVRRRLRVAMVSEGLSPEQIRRARMVPFPTVQAALEDALRYHGPGSSVVVITHGAETIPVLSGVAGRSGEPSPSGPGPPD